MRSTLAHDTPYYKGRVAPFDVKHGLVDPSHTMTMPTSHRTRRTMDFMDYSRKKNDWTSRERQYLQEKQLTLLEILTFGCLSKEITSQIAKETH